MSEITLKNVVDRLGGYEAAGRVCSVTGKAVRKWCLRGKLPRTDWTGETDYSGLLAAASGGYVTREVLLKRRPDGSKSV